MAGLFGSGKENPWLYFFFYVTSNCLCIGLNAEDEGTFFLSQSGGFFYVIEPSIALHLRKSKSEGIASLPCQTLTNSRAYLLPLLSNVKLLLFRIFIVTTEN